MTKSNLLMGASALVAASMALVGGAHAQVASQVYGGGSTLIGPYLRVAGDCYGNPTDLVVQNAYPYDGSVAGSAPSFLTLSPFNYKGTGTTHTGAQNCATTHTSPTSQINYLNSGSGNGELGVFTHDVAIDMGVTTDGAAGHQQYPSIQYGAGDYALGQSEVSAYNNGGTLSQHTGGASGSNVVTIEAPGVAPSGAPLDYANPVANYGAFIQVPISIDAVAIAFSPVYKIDNTSGTPVKYAFNIAKPNADKSGGLKLTIPVLCAIMNGAITNWNDPAIQFLNQPATPTPTGQSLQATADAAAGNPFSVPIQLDGRSDSSGTTSIFYRAMAAQCAGATQDLPISHTGTSYTYEHKSYVNQYLSSGGKTLPAALIPSSGTGGGVPGQFQLGKGSTAVAALIGTLPSPAAGSVALHGDLGYVGTDYVLPASKGSAGGVNTFGLNVADLAISATAIKFYEPTSANALAAFGTLLPPQTITGTSGGYSSTAQATTSYGIRTQPWDWAEPISTTEVIYVPKDHGTVSIPTPLAAPAKGYPIVGTTNVFLNTCYVAGNDALLEGFLNYYYTSPTINNTKTGLLTTSGFGILPTAWKNAIIQTFLTPTSTTTPLGLFLSAAGGGATNPACATATGA